MAFLGFGIGLYPSWNCSGGGNMTSLSTLLHGMGLGFTFSHFPVLDSGVDSFHCFINNLISCPLVSFLRSFFSISILDGLVFKSLFPYLYYMVLSLSPFWVESLYPYSYPYYMVLFLSSFWVESLYLYSYPYYMVLFLSPFWVESLCSYPYVYIIVKFL